MERPASSRIAAPLALRLGPAAGVGEVAEVLADICREIDAALTPIIGSRGVAALHQRSLHLATASHPWLARLDPAALHTPQALPLEQPDPLLAAAGAEAFLQTFYDLLTTLIGAGLTERLLRSVWAHSLSGPPQDPSP